MLLEFEDKMDFRTIINLLTEYKESDDNYDNMGFLEFLEEKKIYHKKLIIKEEIPF